jgi:hypothetical protein
MQRLASRRSISKTGAPTFALQSQSVRRLLSPNAQIYEPQCHCCGAYLKPPCQKTERPLIVEIKIIFSDDHTKYRLSLGRLRGGRLQDSVRGLVSPLARSFSFALAGIITIPLFWIDLGWPPVS